jgi:hypothetical protein
MKDKGSCRTIVMTVAIDGIMRIRHTPQQCLNSAMQPVCIPAGITDDSWSSIQEESPEYYITANWYCGPNAEGNRSGPEQKRHEWTVQDSDMPAGCRFAVLSRLIIQEPLRRLPPPRSCNWGATCTALQSASWPSPGTACRRFRFTRQNSASLGQPPQENFCAHCVHRSVTVHEGALFSVAFSPDGSIVACAGWTGYQLDKNISVYFFETASGAMIGRLGELPQTVSQLVFSTVAGSWLS